METGLYELDEVKQYLHEELNTSLTDEKIEEYYLMISNPKDRVNSKDKRYVACDKNQEYEAKETAFEALKDILLESDEQKIKESIKKTCKQFNDKGITHKERIPFYIIAIAKIKKK